MERKLSKLLLLFAFLALGSILPGRLVQAEVREITLYDRDSPKDWESIYPDGGMVEEEDLFLPGDTGTLTPEGDGYFEEDRIDRIQYESTNPSVVQVDQAGNYRVLAGGIAIVHVKGWNQKEELVFEAGYSFLAGSDVSGMKLGKNSVQGYLFDQSYDNYSTDEMSVSFQNAPALTYYHLELVQSSKPGMAVDYKFDPVKKALVITATGTGTTNLTFKINRKLFTVKVKVSRVVMKKNSALLSAGGKVRLSVKGYPGKIKWISLNKKVATVSASGRVKAKKRTGNTVVYAKIGDHRMGCAVSVVPSKLKKVVNKAKNIYKTCEYSQPKRMSSKYYDCSSLVWKSYRKAGKTFGNKNYAPVAADLAKWCKQKGKMVKGGASQKNVAKMKLRPGDIVFLTGASNGRYKGIYHVEMFTGYRCYGFDGKKPILGTCWAARYDDYGTGLPMVGRP